MRGAMFVITAMSGQAMPASRVISPGALDPNSRIAASCSPDSSSRARGIPIRLFRFPGLRNTRRDRERRQNSISFVVVFPELPVIPTRGMSRWRSRWARAMSPRASTGSRTTKTGLVPASPPWHLPRARPETIAASAPFPNRLADEVRSRRRAPPVSAMKRNRPDVTAVGGDSHDRLRRGDPPRLPQRVDRPDHFGSVILLPAASTSRTACRSRTAAPISMILDILVSFPTIATVSPGSAREREESDRRFPVGLHAEESIPPGDGPCASMSPSDVNRG